MDLPFQIVGCQNRLIMHLDIYHNNSIVLDVPSTICTSLCPAWYSSTSFSNFCKAELLPSLSFSTMIAMSRLMDFASSAFHIVSQLEGSLAWKTHVILIFYINLDRCLPWCTLQWGMDLRRKPWQNVQYMRHSPHNLFVWGSAKGKDNLKTVWTFFHK